MKRFILFVFILSSVFIPSFAQNSTVVRRPVGASQSTKHRTDVNRHHSCARHSGKTSNTSKTNAKSVYVPNSEDWIYINQLVDNMVYVEGGTFTMGATSEQGNNGQEIRDNERPVHQVTLSGYYICKYEVTERQWAAVMGDYPWYSHGDNYPVFKPTWNDCKKFINRLNAITKQHFRFPTEAEWEFAARGGNKSSGYTFAGSNNYKDVMCDRQTDCEPVGQYQPNELGLYDMTGNVDEWCNDWYGPYSSSAQVNPKGPSTGTQRVQRGGCNITGTCYLHVSARSKQFPSETRISGIGLRLAM